MTGYEEMARGVGAASDQPRRVLLVATTTGYQTRMFREAADRAGIELGLATDRCKTLEDPWRDAAVPVRFHDEAASTRAIVARARQTPFHGVLALGDRPTVVAAHAAKALGLPGHAPEAAAASRNKLETRRRLQAAGLPAPWFLAVPLEQQGEPVVPPSFPCVVKPLVLSGSRGVIRADTSAELERALERVGHLLRARDVRALRDPQADVLMIEEYVPGDEYAVEGLMHRGRLRMLAIFDKPDPLVGPYFEETIYVTPSRATASRQAAITTAVGAAIEALGLWHGPVHAECRVEGERVVVLEVAARPIGGLCAKALCFDDAGGELSLEDLLLRHAAGLDVSGLRAAAGASGVMMMPIPRAGIYRGVRGLDDARAVPGVTGIHVTAKPDQRLVPIPEGASYLGFIFARAAEPAAAEAALREGHRRLRFTIDRELAIVPRSE